MKVNDRIVVVFTEDELAAVQAACRAYGMQWPEERTAYEATKSGVWWDEAVERAVPVVQHIMGAEWTAADCGASANLIHGVLEAAMKDGRKE